MTHPGELGYNLDGSPKTSRRGRPRKATGAKTAPKGPAGPSPRSSKPPASGGRRKNYKDGLEGLLHMVALPLLPTQPLDAAAIMVHAESVATAINTTAQSRPEIAAMCEKIMTVGPYGALIGALLKPLAQIAENHGLIPTPMACKFGAVPRDQLAAQLATMVQQVAPEPQVPAQNANGYHRATAGV